MSDTTAAYIGRCGECGGMCAITVDDGANKKHVRKDVADFMKSGMTINRETVASWNEAPNGARGHTDACSRKRKPNPASPVKAQLSDSNVAGSVSETEAQQ